MYIYILCMYKPNMPYTRSQDDFLLDENGWSWMSWMRAVLVSQSEVWSHT